MISTSPCQVKEDFSTKTDTFDSELIQSAKLMRQFTRVKEEVTCSRCPLASSCKVKNKQPADKEKKVELDDVMNLLIGFYQ